MLSLRPAGIAVLAATAIASLAMPDSRAQAPVLQESGLLPSGVASTPGGTQSLLGSMPGGGGILGMQPGKDEMLFGGRAGPSVPRVPTSITMPGGTYQGPQRTLGHRRPPNRCRCRSRRSTGRSRSPKVPRTRGLPTA